MGRVVFLNQDNELAATPNADTKYQANQQLISLGARDGEMQLTKKGQLIDIGKEIGIWKQ